MQGYKPHCMTDYVETREAPEYGECQSDQTQLKSAPLLKKKRNTDHLLRISMHKSVFPWHVFQEIWLTGYDPGLYAGNLRSAEILGLGCFMGLFQQVPHLDVPVLFSNEEHSWSWRRPVAYCAFLWRAGRMDDRPILKHNRQAQGPCNNGCLSQTPQTQCL